MCGAGKQGSKGFELEPDGAAHLDPGSTLGDGFLQDGELPKAPGDSMYQDAELAEDFLPVFLICSGLCQQGVNICEGLVLAMLCHEELFVASLEVPTKETF
jgi:hypothetical protein